MRLVRRVVREAMDGLGCSAIRMLTGNVKMHETKDVPVCIAKPGRAVYVVGSALTLAQRNAAVPLRECAEHPLFSSGLAHYVTWRTTIPQRNHGDETRQVDQA